ncbi:hypothetical protein C0J52_12858 [Blattella germanica]|nr:hypothetical protein C0J52_12858 [Blattella germanica]
MFHFLELISNETKQKNKIINLNLSNEISQYRFKSIHNISGELKDDVHQCFANNASGSSSTWIGRSNHFAISSLGVWGKKELTVEMNKIKEINVMPKYKGNKSVLIEQWIKDVPGLTYDGTIIFCRYCCKEVSQEKKSHINQHLINTQKFLTQQKMFLKYIQQIVYNITITHDSNNLLTLQGLPPITHPKDESGDTSI